MSDETLNATIIGLAAENVELKRQIAQLSKDSELYYKWFLEERRKNEEVTDR